MESEMIEITVLTFNEMILWGIVIMALTMLGIIIGDARRESKKNNG